MINLKNYLKSISYPLITIMSINLITTLLYYFNIINLIASNIINLIALLISCFISGFLLGKISRSKGYIEGLKLGGIITLFLILINFLIKTKFKYTIIFFYILILITCMTGSMLGINYKKTN